ncbi:uncharacterized protein LOC106650348 [Trichogramma pretiosum]|uniref:uncharacterized protein LOC106650348 n=1 Tax=Trichogramma pretiosum TaxID=7493 RepID=UPI0006C98DA0|nr:uncharacterized protein LOC106650348 [Trichogramma pretiosum]
MEDDDQVRVKKSSKKKKPKMGEQVTIADLTETLDSLAETVTQMASTNRNILKNNQTVVEYLMDLRNAKKAANLSYTMQSVAENQTQGETMEQETSARTASQTQE